MILFDVSKCETHHIHSNFKKLSRKLKSATKVQTNKCDLTLERLQSCDLIVFGCPQTKFMDNEIKVLHEFMNGGGSIAIFTSEGGEVRAKSNLNEFLRDYGIIVDRTSVCRCVYHKYFHPKHALIKNGIVQPEIGQEKDKPLTLNSSELILLNRSQIKKSQEDALESSMSLTFVYPNGTTLIVQSPSYAILSSGSTSYPVDCPIAAAWDGDRINGSISRREKQGRLLVLGSADLFSDGWIEKEENDKLCNVLFRFLLHENVTFDPSKGRSDFEKNESVPDITSLANLLKPCLQEEEPLPQDYRSLLSENLFGMSLDNIPDVIDLYKKLQVPYEPLTLVEPHFECPHPPLRITTHQPCMIPPPPPALELFDLDECFSDVRTRLSRLSNHFLDDSDLDQYVQEAGIVVVPDVYESGDAKQDGELTKKVLYNVAEKIFQSKMKSIKYYSIPSLEEDLSQRT